MTLLDCFEVKSKIEMRCLSVVTIMTILLSQILAHSFEREELEDKLNVGFRQWEKKYGKVYKGRKERDFRRKNWKQNMELIIEHNFNFDLGFSSFRMEMNKFGDLNNTEYNAIYNRLKPSDLHYGEHREVYKEKHFPVPNSIDWREKGYVNPVGNQGQCGSCWTFSSTGALEGQHKRVKGELVDISEQNLLDCAKNWGNDGCNGGWMNGAFEYVMQNNGVDSEESYPYKAKEGKCAYDPKNKVATDSGFVDIEKDSEKALKEAVAFIGPIAVAVDASKSSFSYYKSGVYDEKECNSSTTDHAMVVVGYGTTEEGKDYWIVKNSWGTDWGLSGYILMSRNMDNQCAIASFASYPKVEK